MSSFCERIDSLRQYVINGETMIAKPAFLVAIIGDGVDANVYNNNRFIINEWLEERYKQIANQYTKDSQFENITGIENLFGILNPSDGFWNIIYSPANVLMEEPQTPSKA